MSTVLPFPGRADDERMAPNGATGDTWIAVQERLAAMRRHPAGKGLARVPASVPTADRDDYLGTYPDLGSAHPGQV